MRAEHFRDLSPKTSLGVTLAGLALLVPLKSWSVAQHGSSPSPNPPAKVPAGVILVKGAWSSASDSTTPVPEAATVTSHDFHSPYFHLSYALAAGWAQKFAGPPPSDRGYYVLAQLQPVEAANGAIRGSVLITAQDMFFAPIRANNALELVSYTGSHLRAD